MSERWHAIVDNRGKIIESTISSDAETEVRRMFDANHGLTWKQAMRMGYRCVRVEVRVLDEEGGERP